MSARFPQHCVAVLAVTLVVASVAPWVATAGAATGGAATAAEPSASFEKRVVYEQRGDVANITVHTSQTATVNIGSGFRGFWLQVTVGKGTTKLRLNTYKAGESDRYPVSEMVWAAEGQIKTRKLMTTSIDAPLDTAEYNMNVTINDRERAIATLVVQERQTDGITARIAPKGVGSSELSSAAGVQEHSVSPRKASVAHDDWLLVRVDATGVRGALEKARLDGDGGVMRVEFVQRNPPPNGQPNRFTGASVERVFVDGTDEGFYLLVDTGDHGIEPGDDYRISFVVPAVSPLAEFEQNVTTWIQVTERQVSVNRNGPGRQIVVDGETTITGTTTLTPGSTINISARDTGTDPFLRPRTVTVDEDGTFSVTYDFSNLDPGREFEFRLGDQGQTIPAVVAGPTTTTTTQPTTTTTQPTTTTTVSTTTQPPTTATTVPTTEKAKEDTESALTQQAVKTEAGEDNGGPVPGFGPVAGLAALAVGLVLAIRRL